MAKEKHKKNKAVPMPDEQDQNISDVAENTEVTVETEDVPQVAEAPAPESEEPITLEEHPPTHAVVLLPETTSSVTAHTHSKNRTKKQTKIKPVKKLNKVQWPKIAGLVAGVVALLLLLVSGVLSQYFKGKTLPNVSVASISSAAKRPDQLKPQLQEQIKNLKVTIKAGDKKLEPSFEEIGFEVDVDKTVENALNAKRDNGLFTKLSFWRKQNVPAVITVNDTLLGQYLETRLPELSKPPQDAQMVFNLATSTFSITEQADGQGADAISLKEQLISVGNALGSAELKVETATKAPSITKDKLEPLIEPANMVVSRRIILTGLGYTYQAKPSDIASWITPTPKDSGEIKLVIDPAKIQSYIDGIGKKISSAPVDKKVLKDETSGAEVTLQEGRDGTELADRPQLADAIAQSLKAGQDSTQTMNIKVAAFQTVNMNAFDKWIEVDLSEQRTTAYEKATPVNSFIIASGVRGHETVIGEFAIWLKVRSQTMQGGSKADGSYYSIPNVEWVSYFYQDYALHGAWWRSKFGVPASHGCVNMTNADAQWVYNWAPVGTKVIVHA